VSTAALASPTDKQAAVAARWVAEGLALAALAVIFVIVTGLLVRRLDPPRART
jgi:hypothetical protein